MRPTETWETPKEAEKFLSFICDSGCTREELELLIGTWLQREDEEAGECLKGLLLERHDSYQTWRKVPQLGENTLCRLFPGAIPPDNAHERHRLTPAEIQFPALACEWHGAAKLGHPSWGDAYPPNLFEFEEFAESTGHTYQVLYLHEVEQRWTGRMLYERVPQYTDLRWVRNEEDAFDLLEVWDAVLVRNVGPYKFGRDCNWLIEPSPASEGVVVAGTEGADVFYAEDSNTGLPITVRQTRKCVGLQEGRRFLYAVRPTGRRFVAWK